MKQGKAKYATIKDVAKLANTSIATVSYVLRDDPERVISDELRHRVLDAAETLNYNKNFIASGLRGSSRGLVTILIPQFSNIFFTRVCEKIEDVCIQNNLIPMICDTREDPERELRLIENAINQRTDGIIIGPTSEGWKNTEMIRSMGIPLVAIGREIVPPEEKSDEACYFVGDNGYEAGYLAGSTFASYGHKNIGMVEWSGTVSSAMDRRKGFFDALSDGVGAEGELTVESSSVLTVEEGYELTKRLLTRTVPTAIFYGYHRLAQGGIIYLRERGFTIPRDISVMLVGTPAWAQIATPQFSTINQNEDNIGTTAGKVLMSLITGKDNNGLTKDMQHIFPCAITNYDSIRRID